MTMKKVIKLAFIITCFAFTDIATTQEGPKVDVVKLPIVSTN